MILPVSRSTSKRRVICFRLFLEHDRQSYQLLHVYDYKNQSRILKKHHEVTKKVRFMPKKTIFPSSVFFKIKTEYSLDL